MSDSMTYIARKPCCGGIVAAIVDSPDHRRETAKEVASWVRDGLPVERVTTEAARAAKWGCKCQKGLPLAAAEGAGAG